MMVCSDVSSDLVSLVLKEKCFFFRKTDLIDFG